MENVDCAGSGTRSGVSRPHEELLLERKMTQFESACGQRHVSIHVCSMLEPPRPSQLHKPGHLPPLAYLSLSYISDTCYYKSPDFYKEYLDREGLTSVQRACQCVVTIDKYRKSKRSVKCHLRVFSDL
jgi:hypothetical protein